MKISARRISRGSSTSGGLQIKVSRNSAIHPVPSDHGDRPLLGIDDPIFRDPSVRVERPFLLAVTIAGRGRQDLDDQRRKPRTSSYLLASSGGLCNSSSVQRLVSIAMCIPRTPSQAACPHPASAPALHPPPQQIPLQQRPREQERDERRRTEPEPRRARPRTHPPLPDREVHRAEHADRPDHR